MNRLKEILNYLTPYFSSDTLTGAALKTISAALIALIVWLIIKLILGTVHKRLQSVDIIRINSRLFQLVRKTCGYAILLLLGLYVARLFQFGFLEKLLPALFILLFAGPAREFLVTVLSYFEKKWVDKTTTKVDNIIFDLLNKFSGAIIYVVAAVLALDQLGVNVMPFVAGAGVLGIAVGFAAKDTLSNLIAGILLIIDRPFEIGDRIEVWSAPAGSATWGDVIDIGLRATKIKTTDNIVIVIPNNEIMKRDIVNYTLISSDIRVRINIGVSYDTDIELAKAAILKAAAEVEWILKTPKPRVVVRTFGESSVDLQLRVWIGDARKRMATISAITDRVKCAFDAEGIEIPYPKRDIHIVQSNGKKSQK